jgi:hypothetical protein
MSDELRHSAVVAAAVPRLRCRSRCTVRRECHDGGANAVACSTWVEERAAPARHAAINIAVGVLDETIIIYL